MLTCNGSHPPNALCMDRRCYLGNKNPFLRLLRRLDRKTSECQSLRESLAKRMKRGREA